MLPGVFKWLVAWVLASIMTHVLGSALMTQVVLRSLARFDIPVDLGARISMTIFDVGGLASSYLPLVAIALLLGFLVAALIARWKPAWRTTLYLLAGASAVGTMLGIMILTFGMNPLAGARGFNGIALQMLAGLFGAWVFLRIVDGASPPEEL